MDFIKKHRLLLIALGILVIMGIIVSRHHAGDRPEKKVNVEKKAMSIGDYLNLMAPEASNAERDPSQVPTYEVKTVPFIKKVNLEKNTVCVGEEFQVTIESSDPEGRGADLVSSVGASVGNPVILRYKSPGKHKIVATVRDFKRIDTRIVEVEVVNCEGKPAVYLNASLHPYRMEEGEFEVVQMTGLTGKCVYQWEFGDGTTKTTNRGYATHNYGMRDQKRFNSSFLVKLTVTDEKNVSVSTRASLDFPNIQWISAHMGSPSVPVIFDRFLQKKNGAFSAAISMKNIYRQPVSFTDADVEFTSCDSSKGSQKTTVSAASFMPQTALAGGEAAKGTISFAGDMVPKSTCVIGVNLHGTSGDGKAVRVVMNFTIPVSYADLKVKQHEEIENEELDRKIATAKRLLGKDFVTQDDLYTLEKEGMFDE